MLRALIVPALVLVICWVVWYFDFAYHLKFYKYGVKPRTAQGALGIILYPFIHDTHNVNHMVNNSSALIVLMWALFYFYKEIAWKVLIGIWLIGGAWLWCLSREAYHIGASGIIYGLAAYIFFGGVARKDVRLMGVSMFVAFMYGSMVWGILPFDYLLGAHKYDLSISFEGHLWGAAAGVLLAFFFKKQGPQKKKYQWQIEEEMGIEPPDFEGDIRRQEEAARILQQERERAIEEARQIRINYIIKKQNDEKKPPE